MKPSGPVPAARAKPLGRKQGKRRFAVPALIALVLVFVTGFALFAEHISDMHQPQSINAADGIVVLTGGQSRMEAAYGLLAAGKGKRLLISGVHPAIGEKSLLQALGADPSKFECCVDIDHKALETVGNAAESVKWAQRLGFTRIILVTNNYHMPRSLLEFRRVRHKLQIVPYPVVNSDLGKGSWVLRPNTIRVLFAEYLKYLGALSRAVLPVPASISSMTGSGKPS